MRSFFKCLDRPPLSAVPAMYTVARATASLSSRGGTGTSLAPELHQRAAAAELPAEHRPGERTPSPSRYVRTLAAAPLGVNPVTAAPGCAVTVVSRSVGAANRTRLSGVRLGPSRPAVVRRRASDVRFLLTAAPKSVAWRCVRWRCAEETRRRVDQTRYTSRVRASCPGRFGARRLLGSHVPGSFRPPRAAGRKRKRRS